jgi:hypothetical protein
MSARRFASSGQPRPTEGYLVVDVRNVQAQDLRGFDAVGRHLRRPPGNLNPDHTYVINPVTPYGERQVPAERAIAALAEDEFSPPSLQRPPRRRGTLRGVQGAQP